eukprot:scaffold131668_cov23-Tisochrysis_lutea.AAC.5
MQKHGVPRLDYASPLSSFTSQVRGAKATGSLACSPTMPAMRGSVISPPTSATSTYFLLVNFPSSLQPLLNRIGASARGSSGARHVILPPSTSSSFLSPSFLITSLMELEGGCRQRKGAARAKHGRRQSKGGRKKRARAAGRTRAEQ